MPTGYTADVADGSVSELEPFILQLARGMGALIMMRDSPSSAPIPERFEPSRYHTDKLVDLRAERDRLYALTDAQAQAAAVAEFDADEKSRVDYYARQDAQRDRYEAMLAKLQTWEGAPEGIKEFGIEQLQRSIEFDCPRGRSWYGTPIERDGKKWRAAKLAKVAKDIEYHAVEDAKERERTESRNVWIAQLRASLASAKVQA